MTQFGVCGSGTGRRFWLLAAMLAPHAARAERARLGEVSAASGTTLALWAGLPPRPLQVASPVLLDDTLTTGPDARLACQLEGEIALRLGANASLRIDAITLGGPHRHVALHGFGGPLLFDRPETPAAPPPTTLVLPWARMGVRGTCFFAGPLDDRLAVFVARGEVTVAAGSIISVLGAGDGVDMPLAGGVLGPVTRWREPRIARALALVS